MTEHDPIALMFGGMDKLGPGSDEDTVAVLRALPRQQFRQVVDAGCGSGRQTLALARQLNTPVHAVDTYAPFLEALDRKARQLGLGGRVATHCLGMEAIPDHFRDIDLLWSEASAYSIGFERALRLWHGALAAGGLVVVSELCWLEQQRPPPAQAFWAREYPGMQSQEQLLEVIDSAGYRLLDSHLLPKRTWFEGYYDELGPRADRLLQHPDEQVRAMAQGVQEEIAVLEQYHGSFGYLFFSLQRRD